MFDLTFGQGPHAGYILASYALTAATLAGLVVWIVLDRRRQRLDLADLAARGVRRRSAEASRPGAPS